jgi:hypothetical protein
MAGMPRPPTFNPYRWARARLGRDEDDLDLADDDNEAFYGSWQQPAGGQVPLAKPIDPKAADQPKGNNLRTRRRDGRALIIEGQKHPIPALMRRAKKRWARLQARQSKTFAQAITEYRKRYGRAPPKGFDRWCATIRTSAR